MSLSVLFFLSSVGASVLLSPASATPNAASLAPTPLTALQANWSFPNGNALGQDYNPQNQINASNAQYLGLAWLFPLPTHPTALLSVGGGLGVDTAILIVNGTVYATTQYGQVFALNAANGNVLWTDVLPLAANSTVGQGAGSISLHLHDGAEQFTAGSTSKLFGGTPTYWINAPNHVVYAINAATGAYELNFSYYGMCVTGSKTVPASQGGTPCGVTSVPGNNPLSSYTALATNILIDQTTGVIITSMLSTSANNAARCFFRAWNLLATPPSLLWTDFCSPPQVGSNVPVDPNWDMKQVNNMTGAQIFYPGPQYNGGGTIPNTAVVDLKTLSQSDLNSTLYNDWGYVQSAHCATEDGGASTGGLGAGWGGQWLLGTGPTAGQMIVNTGNRGPYNGDCNPGPDLWASSVMSLNEQTGAWNWGFQVSAHDEWDWDCSWWQALGNETVAGANTQVVWKTCKSGYLYELNAKTGSLIWAYTPTQSILERCAYCYMLNPLNRSQMTQAFLNPSLANTLVYPTTHGGFENEPSYSPTLNYIFTASQNYPSLESYVALNSTNYGKTSGLLQLAGGAGPNDNTTIEAVNAANGQQVWTHYISTQGYRGGIMNSGGVVYLTFSSGEVLMLDAKTGATIKDLFIGGPLNVLPSIGATTSGTMEVIFPITAGSVTWGTGVPGDIVALTLQNVPTTTTNTVTATSTVSGSATTSTQTITSTAAATGVSTTTLYGVAAVAVIFIIATGYLAMRGRKPAP